MLGISAPLDCCDEELDPGGAGIGRLGLLGILLGDGIDGLPDPPVGDGMLGVGIPELGEPDPEDEGDGKELGDPDVGGLDCGRLLDGNDCCC